jgi:hypothetical protein
LRIRSISAAALDFKFSGMYNFTVIVICLFKMAESGDGVSYVMYIRSYYLEEQASSVRAKKL